MSRPVLVYILYGYFNVVKWSPVPVFVSVETDESVLPELVCVTRSSRHRYVILKKLKILKIKKKDKEIMKKVKMVYIMI